MDMAGDLDKFHERLLNYTVFRDKAPSLNSLTRVGLRRRTSSLAGVDRGNDREFPYHFGCFRSAVLKGRDVVSRCAGRMTCRGSVEHIPLP